MTGRAQSEPDGTPGPSPAHLVPRSPDELVVGVVIDLPEPVATELRSARKAAGDVDGADIHPHVTLLPPRLLAGAEQEAIRAHLAAIAARTGPFRLTLSGTGTFRPVSPVVYVRVDGDTEALHGLQAAVCAGPLAGELAFRFHPHVTVAHRVPDEDLDGVMVRLQNYRAAFVVQEFSLYLKDPDGAWRRRRRMPLTGAAARMGGEADPT